MPTSAERTSSKWRKATSNLPSRNSTRMPASQVPLAETTPTPTKTAIPIRADDDADAVDVVVVAVTSQDKSPQSGAGRTTATSRTAVTKPRLLPPEARVATSVLKNARLVTLNAPTEIQRLSSLQTRSQTNPSNNRLNAVRKSHVVPSLAAIVVAEELTIAATAATADVGATDNAVKLVAKGTTPEERENLGAKSQSTVKTVAPRDNAPPESRSLSTMTEMTLSILAMTLEKIRLAIKTLRLGTRRSAQSSMAT